MYHPQVIQQNVARLESATGIRLARYDTDKRLEIKAALDKLWDGTKPRRPLSPEEQTFIRNERLLSKCDFLYWATAYAMHIQDGGGLGPFRPWQSQRVVLEHLAKAELEMHEANAKGETVQGIKVVAHKARQLGMTMLVRILTMHRLCFSTHLRAMAASVDDDKVLELYERDKLIYDCMPWWMRPKIAYDEKAMHITWEPLGTKLLYQQAKQQSGLGQGRQFELGHLTECASWPYPNMIALDYIPTIPQSLNTLVVLESTAQGRGNFWHDFTEDVRKQQVSGWLYIFIPWYAEHAKYRLTPPANWTPSETSFAHAQQVHETSREFVGRPVMLSKEQLYWYETQYKNALRRNELNIFKTNFCATPEESFQHTTTTPFSSELLDALRLDTVTGSSYEVAVA